MNIVSYKKKIKKEIKKYNKSAILKTYILEF